MPTFSPFGGRSRSRRAANGDSGDKSKHKKKSKHKRPSISKLEIGDPFDFAHLATGNDRHNPALSSTPIISSSANAETFPSAISSSAMTLIDLSTAAGLTSQSPNTSFRTTSPPLQNSSPSSPAPLSHNPHTSLTLNFDSASDADPPTPVREEETSIAAYDHTTTNSSNSNETDKGIDNNISNDCDKENGNDGTSDLNWKNHDSGHSVNDQNDIGMIVKMNNNDNDENAFGCDDVIENDIISNQNLTSIRSSAVTTITPPATVSVSLASEYNEQFLSEAKARHIQHLSGVDNKINNNVNASPSATSPSTLSTASSVSSSVSSSSSRRSSWNAIVATKDSALGTPNKTVSHTQPGFASPRPKVKPPKFRFPDQKTSSPKTGKISLARRMTGSIRRMAGPSGIRTANSGSGGSRDKRQPRKRTRSAVGGISRRLSGSPLACDEQDFVSQNVFELLRIQMSSAYTGNPDQALQLGRTLDEHIKSGFNVCTVDEDSHTLLDIAVTMNNWPAALILLSRGCCEHQAYLMPSMRARRLEERIKCKEQTMALIQYEVKQNLSGSKEEFRRELSDLSKLYRKTQDLYDTWINLKDTIVAPGPCTLVSLQVAGPKSVILIFPPLEMSETENVAVVTRYKLEWSETSNFENYEELIIQRCQNYVIKGLKTGSRCYVRVSPFNASGFGPYAKTLPYSVIPSTWRDLDLNPSRFDGVEQQLDAIRADTVESGILEPDPIDQDEEGSREKANNKKPKVKGLKFQTALRKRKIYVCLAIIHESSGEILLRDRQLPMLAIDDTPSSESLAKNFWWIVKLSQNWNRSENLLKTLAEDVKALKFRREFVQIVLWLQHFLGSNDIGNIFCNLIAEKHGTNVVLLSKEMCSKPPRAGFGSGFFWSPIPSSVDLVDRQTFHEKFSYEKVGIFPLQTWHSVKDASSFSGTCREKLEPGLYLGFVEAVSTMKGIKIRVSRDATNVLPCVKVRESSCVSADEWSWMKSLETETVVAPDGSLDGSRFQGLLSSCIDIGAKLMGWEDELKKCRVYIAEIFEVNPDTNLILVLPPKEKFLATIVADGFDQHENFVDVTLEGLQMTMLGAYRPSTWSRFCELSVEVDSRIITYEQKKRSATSKEAKLAAKKNLEIIQAFKTRLDSIWHRCNWFAEVVNKAQNDNSEYCISVDSTLSKGKNLETTKDHADEVQNHLQSSDLYCPQDLSKFWDLHRNREEPKMCLSWI
eukprot:UC4_evm2s1421